MQRMRLPILAVFLAAALVLAGCSGKGAETPKAETPADQKAVSDSQPIKIGVNAELTGRVASYGQSFVQGAELYVEELNKNGGVLGRKVELVKVDNKSEKADATNAALRLIEQDKVVAILGAATSGITMAFAPIAEEHKVPFVSPSATSPDVTVKDGKTLAYAFRACFIDPFQGEVAAKFALNDLKAKRAALLVNQSDEYAIGLANSFKETFLKGGGEIVAEEKYSKGDKDFNSALTRIKAQKPDVLYLPNYYEDVGLQIRQARDLGLDIPILGGDGWDSPELVKLAGSASNLNNAYMTAHFSPESTEPAVQTFVKLFKEKYGSEPNGFHALGYDAAGILIDAIKRAGEANPQKIRDALEATKDFQGVTGKISFDDKHNPVKSAVIIEFKDGKQTYRTTVQP